MGLDVSHDAFSGAYGAFNRLRQAVALACGGSFPPHDDDSLEEEQIYFEPELTPPGVIIFLRHSDCDGEISAEDCVSVADGLEEIAPKVMRYPDRNLSHFGGAPTAVRTFATGCRAAAKANEPLTFQ